MFATPTSRVRLFGSRADADRQKGDVMTTLARNLISILTALLISMGGFLAFTSLAATQSEWSAPSAVYFPQTGHSVRGEFLVVWNERGGESFFGAPISEEFGDGEHTVQYFENARFELWIEGDHEGHLVHLGDVGAELLSAQLEALQATGTTSDSPLIDAVRAVDPRTIDLVKTDSRFIEQTQHTVKLGFRDIWESTGETEFLGNPLSEEYWFGNRVYQFFERGQLFWDPQEGSFKVPVGRKIAELDSVNVTPIPQGDLPTYSTALFEPPPPPAPTPDPYAERWIEVDLSWQYLIAWQGDVRVNETYVSTGRSGFETPTGTFFINSKLESQDMEGTIGGEYYNVPAVPWVMYFTDYGHAIHGTYWHNNFGTPMSHGCVNVPLGVAEWLFSWASIGTRVYIHY